LNLGLRFDHNTASFASVPTYDRSGQQTGQVTPEVNDLFSWNSLSPRLGVAWTLDERGRSVLKAHYGRYYRGIMTGEFGDAGPSITPRFLFSGTYDEAGLPIGAQKVSDNSNLEIDPGFDSPYTDQFIVAFEREVVEDLGVAVEYIYKRGRRTGGWRDTGGRYVTVPFVDDQGQDATGRTIQVFDLVNDPTERLFLLTNPDGLFTSYHGLSLQLTKRMSRKWQMVSSLTLSRATGRVGSSNNAPFSSQSTLAFSFGRDPNDYINSDGRLIGDRPVIFKTQAVYQPGWGITLAANYQFMSGRPWGRRARVPGLSLPTSIRAETLDGSRRLADWSLLDLRAQKQFDIGPSKRANLAVFADLLNALNRGTYQAVGSQLGTSDAFGVPTLFINPRTLMLGAKFRF
jgi:hypothetical protein